MFKFSLTRLSALVLSGSLLILTACTTVQQPKAIAQPSPKSTNTATATPTATKNVSNIKVPNTHIVKAGETLSIIAGKYGLDYVDIAKLNKIPAPYNKIQKGQRLNLKGLKPASIANEVTTKTWVRPVSSQQRKLFHGQYETVYYKGKIGDSIYAVADGYVVYADVTTNTDKLQHKKLNEKGHTIIITHADGYHSVYTHLSRIMVPAGTYVKSGQRIAELGQSGDVTEPLLGFQIKHNGKFINPRPLLP